MRDSSQHETTHHVGTFRLDCDVYAWLVAQADTHHTNVTEMIRRLLRDQMEQEREYALIADEVRDNTRRILDNQERLYNSLVARLGGGG